MGCFDNTTITGLKDFTNTSISSIFDFTNTTIACTVIVSSATSYNWITQAGDYMITQLGDQLTFTI